MKWYEYFLGETESRPAELKEFVTGENKERFSLFAVCKFSGYRKVDGFDIYLNQNLSGKSSMLSTYYKEYYDVDVKNKIDTSNELIDELIELNSNVNSSKINFAS